MSLRTRAYKMRALPVAIGSSNVNDAVVGESVENLFDFILCGLDAVAGHPIATCQLGGIKRGIGFRQ